MRFYAASSPYRISYAVLYVLGMDSTYTLKQTYTSDNASKERPRPQSEHRPGNSHGALRVLSSTSFSHKPPSSITNHTVKPRAAFCAVTLAMLNTSRMEDAPAKALFTAESSRREGFTHVLLMTTGSVASVKAPLIVQELLTVRQYLA